MVLRDNPPSSTPTGLLASLSPLLGVKPVDPIKELKKFKASKEGQALVVWVKDQYTKTKQARSREVYQWNLNLAMYFGNHNVAVESRGRDAGKLYTPKGARNVERLVINRIRPLIRTELARLLSQKPAASVIPASSEDEDLMAAMAGEQVWESLCSRRAYHTQFSKAAFWLTTTGTSFLKTYWDVNKQVPGESSLGDIVFSATQPYNLFVPDLLEPDIEEQPYVLEVQVRSVALVNYQYKSVLDKPATATARAAISVLEDAYVNQRTDDNAKPDSVLMYEMWIKQGGCSYMPEGGYVQIIGDEIVEFYRDGLPYDHKEYPYTRFENIPTSKFYGASVIEDVLQLNREYNKIRSQIADNRRKTGVVQYQADKGSILPERMTNEAGLFILVRPGSRLPTQVQPASLPPYISENMDRVLSDIEDISGQHQVSKGNTPPGVTAATAISYLQERDDSLLLSAYQSIEAGTERVARQGLSLCVQYWDLPRLVKTVGADGAFDTQLLAGSQLVNGIDIRIESGSALPQSKAAKQAFIMDLMKFGFIQPEDGLKMMEIGGAQKLLEQLRSDEKQAQRENVRMKSLTPEVIMMFSQEWDAAVQQNSPTAVDTATQQPLEIPPVISVNSYDNHTVHIEVHNRYRRGQAFELLPDEIRAQFESHVNHHKAMVAQEQMMMGMGGMPAGMGEVDPSMPDDMGASPDSMGAPTGDYGSMSQMMQQEGGDLGG